QISNIDHAFDVVDLVPEDRDSRVLRFDYQPPGIADGRRRIDRDNLGARLHHLIDTRVTEFDYRLDQFAFRFLDDAFFFADVYECLNLVLCFIFLFLGNIVLGIRLAHLVEKMRDRSHKHGKEAIENLKRRKQRPKHIVRMILSQQARNQLAKQHYNNKGGDKRQDQGRAHSRFHEHIGEQDRDCRNRKLSSEYQHQLEPAAVLHQLAKEALSARSVFALPDHHSQGHLAQRLISAFDCRQENQDGEHEGGDYQLCKHIGSTDP